MSETQSGNQLLHLVFGGEITEPGSTQFRDLNKLDVVGNASAYGTWKTKAQQTPALNGPF